MVIAGIAGLVSIHNSLESKGKGDGLVAKTPV
jgi:hypothetical protein